MFVRRLLVSAVLACLAACAAPTSTFVVDKNPNLKQSTAIGSVNALDYQLMPKRSAAAFSTTVSTQNASSTALCLQQHLSSEFKLPPEFVSHKVYTDNNHSVGLVNPFTQVEGITMDVVNKGGSSEIKLYDNGNLLSRAWKQLPSKCGQGKTTTLAQDTGSSKAASKPQNGIDFVSASKSGTSIADSSKPVLTAAATPAVIKATPLVQAEPIRELKDTPVVTPLQAATAASAVALTALKPLQRDASTVVSSAPVISTPTPHVTPSQQNFIVPAAAAPTNQAVSNRNAWQHGDLTQDDMSIIAPATAAVVTPAMAIAAQNMATQEAPHLAAAAKQVSSTATPARSVKTDAVKPNTNSTKALETSKTKTTAAATRKKVNDTAAKEDTKTSSKNTKNSKPTAKESASNSRNKANDSKTTGKNSKGKTDKADDNKNSRSKNSKASAAEEKANSKNKSSKAKADSKADDNKNSKGKKTAARDVKDDNSKNSKKKTDNKANDSSKNNKKSTQERDNSSKAKASSNKSKATDKKAESAKKPAKKDKAK